MEFHNIILLSNSFTYLFFAGRVVHDIYLFLWRMQNNKNCHHLMVMSHEKLWEFSSHWTSSQRLKNIWNRLVWMPHFYLKKIYFKTFLIDFKERALFAKLRSLSKFYNKKVRWSFSSHFRPLLKQSLFFETAWVGEKIGSSNEPKHHKHIWQI